MTWARAAALAGSLCLHGVVLAFALRQPGPGINGPDSGGDASAIFSPDPVSEPPASPPAAANLSDLAPAPPTPEQPTISDEEMILPLEDTVQTSTPEPRPIPPSGGGRTRKLPGPGIGTGRGGGGDDGSYLAPSYLNNPAPAYPLKARISRQEGLVMLTVTVTLDGRPADIEVLRSSGNADLDRAAVAAVRRWIFHPAMAGDRAITARVEVPIRFRLK